MPATARRSSVLALTALAVVVLVAAPASAHVTVNPSTATQGGFTELAFRVPTESDTASTTKVQVFLPADQPLAFVAVKPHPGWTFRVVTTKLSTPIDSDDGPVTQAVSEITWTSTSAATAIKPGEYDDFDVSVGPLPTKGDMVFKALQTYSDGSIVRWIDPTTPGAAEPEHPAPVLTLVPAASADATATDTSGATQAPTVSGTADTTADTADGSSSTLPTVLSVVALLVALGAAGLAYAGRRRG